MGNFSKLLLIVYSGIAFCLILSVAFTYSFSPIPEPTVILLFGIGLVGIVAAILKKKR